MELLDLDEKQYHRALTSNSRLAFALLPKEKEVFTKLVRDGHQTGSKQAWWDPAMAKCRHCPGDAKDDLCHIFYGCVMFPALYWARALEIFDGVLTLTKHCGPTLRTANSHDIALCLLGVDTTGGLAPPFWILFQRISIRAIWCFYTGHKYGDDIGPHLDTQPTGLCKLSVRSTMNRIATEWNSHVWKSNTLTEQESHKSAIMQFNRTWLPLMCVRLPRKRHNAWLDAYELFYRATARQEDGRPTLMVHKSINIMLARD